MCGIVGINSFQDVTSRVIEGLACLEYRGYDLQELQPYKKDNLM